MSDLHYMAGIFDSEGSVHISQRRETGRITGRISICMADKEPLETFKKYFGHNINLCKFSNKSWSDSYKWQVANKSALPVVVKLKPFLQIARKTAAIECLIEFTNLLLPKGKHPLPQSNLDKRIELKQRCQQLNREKPPKGSPKRTRNQELSIDILSYFGGLFDGDGCASISRRSKNLGDVRPGISFEMCDIEPLELLHKHLGGELVVPKLRRGHSQTYLWRVRGQKASEVFRLLVPYSRVPRKRKALICAWESAQLTCYKGKEVPLYVRKTQEELWLKTSILNRKGKRSIDVDNLEVTILVLASQLTLW